MTLGALQASQEAWDPPANPAQVRPCIPPPHLDL